MFVVLCILIVQIIDFLPERTLFIPHNYLLKKENKNDPKIILKLKNYQESLFENFLQDPPFLWLQTPFHIFTLISLFEQL
jgi:hypothetical protein